MEKAAFEKEKDCVSEKKGCVHKRKSLRLRNKKAAFVEKIDCVYKRKRLRPRNKKDAFIKEIGCVSVFLGFLKAKENMQNERSKNRMWSLVLFLGGCEQGSRPE